MSPGGFNPNSLQMLRGMMEDPPKELWPSRNSQGVYKILEGLYVSGIEGAKEIQTLQKEGVTHILNLVGPSVYDHPLAGGRQSSYFPDTFRYKIFETEDTPEQDLMKYFPQTSQFIDQGRKAGGVLVHCFAGVSRSATVILAYMLDTLHLDLGTAFQVLTRGRPQAYPNRGFQLQLVAHEDRVRSRAGEGKQLQAESHPHLLQQLPDSHQTPQPHLLQHMQLLQLQKLKEDYHLKGQEVSRNTVPDVAQAPQSPRMVPAPTSPRMAPVSPRMMHAGMARAPHSPRALHTPNASLFGSHGAAQAAAQASMAVPQPAQPASTPAFGMLDRRQSLGHIPASAPGLMGAGIVDQEGGADALKRSIAMLQDLFKNVNGGHPGPPAPLSHPQASPRAMGVPHAAMPLIPVGQPQLLASPQAGLMLVNGAADAMAPMTPVMNIPSTLVRNRIFA